MKRNEITADEIGSERERLVRAAELLPNRWVIAVGAGLFLGLKSTGFGFEMTPTKFYQLFMETVKYVCLSLVVVSVWMTMFRFFVGRFRGELTWFAILMVFIFSTEAFANLFLQIGKQIATVNILGTPLPTGNNDVDERRMSAAENKRETTVVDSRPGDDATSDRH